MGKQCVKSVRIQCSFGPFFPHMNWIWTKTGKTRNTNILNSVKFAESITLNICFPPCFEFFQNHHICERQCVRVFFCTEAEDESQFEKVAFFWKNNNYLLPDTRTCVCVSRGYEISIFRQFYACAKWIILSMISWLIALRLHKMGIDLGLYS